MRQTTVKELGNVLPDSGESFSFESHTGRREKDIYKLMNSKPSFATNLPWQVRCCLAVLLRSVGSVTFPEYGKGESKLADLEKRGELFDSLFLSLGDAYYLYVCARIESIGNELKVTLTCPNCKYEQNNYTINLNDLIVKVYETEEDTKKEIDLVLPVTLGEKKYTKATVSGLRFTVPQERLDSFADAKLDSVAETTTLVGSNTPLAVELISDWPTRVINQVYTIINELTPGIDQMFEFTCANCESKNPYAVNWEYLGFFS